MIVYVDVDGTCGDLMTQWLGKYNGDFDDNLTPEKLTGWNLEEVVDPRCGKNIYEYIENPNIYDNVEPIDGALDGVNYIRSLGHRVVFATSTTNGCAGRKLNWLIDNGFLSRDDLKGTTHPDYIEIHDKGLLLGDILIDDGPHNVEKFNGYAILFKQPHNKDFMWPVKSDWAHIREYIHNGTIPPGTHPTELKSPNQAREFKEIIRKMYEVHLAKNFDYCVSPKTKVLTTNLTWVEIKDIKVGDKLIGFTDKATGWLAKRKYEESIVESITKVNLPSHKITLEDGTELISSTKHPWLSMSGSTGRWLETEKLQDAEHYTHPSKLVRLFNVWEYDNSRDAGYLSAALDGEGWLTHKPNPSNTRKNQDNWVFTLGFAQRDNEMLAEVERILSEKGIEHRRKFYGSTYQIILSNRNQIVELIGSIRPVRLLSHIKPTLGRIKHYPLRIIKNEFIGNTDLISIKTSSGTYIADGIASHNSPANILVTGQTGLITRLWDKIARFCNLTGYTVSMKDEKDIGATMFYTMNRILAFGGFLNKLTLTFTGVKKEPKNESIDDSLYDMAVYAIIGLLLRKGKWGK